MTNKTNNNIYVVFSYTESSINGWSEETCQLEEHWFTSEEQAELCAEYLNMLPDNIGSFFVAEVTNGDDIDYKALIEEEERKQKEREANREKELRFRNVDNYALFKSRVEGCGYGETLEEFKEKYADYIDGKE